MDNTATFIGVGSNGAVNPGAQQPCIFPLLKLDVILKCMSEMDMDMTQEELEDPAHHKEKLRKVFAMMLELCTGKAENDFLPTMSMRAKAATFPNPELHQDNFTEVQFYRYLLDMLETAGYTNFSWRDLHAPTAKRLRYQLSAIINLAKFRDDFIWVLEGLNEQRQELLQTFENTTNESDRLLEYEQETIHESKAKFREMEAVLRECEELEVEIATNNKLQAAAREEAAALKKKGNELKDHVVTAVWALQEAEAEEEKLRLQVVTSPDRRKSEKLVREERLRKAKVECAELDELAQAHKTKLVNGKQAVNELETHTNVALVELLDISNKHTEFVRKMEDTRRKLASHKKNRAEIDEQMEESDIELTRLEKAIVQQRKQHTLQMDAAQESLEQSQSRLLHVERERRNGMARVDAGAANVQALQAQIDLERREAEAKVQALISHYQTVEQAFLNRNQLYMDALPSHSEN